MTDDAFGFGSTKKSLAEKLRDIQPGSAERQEPQLDRIDSAAASHGFVQREVRGTGLLRRKREIGPTLAINMRVPERVAVPFIRFCEDNRFSYWEGVEHLMKRCGIGDL